MNTLLITHYSKSCLEQRTVFRTLTYSYLKLIHAHVNSYQNVFFFSQKSNNNEPNIYLHPHLHTYNRDLVSQCSHCAWRLRHDRLTGCHVWRPNVSTANTGACAPMRTPHPDHPTPPHSNKQVQTLHPHPCLLIACWPGGVGAQSWTQLPHCLPKCQDLTSVQQNVDST